MAPTKKHCPIMKLTFNLTVETAHSDTTTLIQRLQYMAWRQLTDIVEAVMNGPTDEHLITIASEYPNITIKLETLTPSTTTLTPNELTMLKNDNFKVGD